MSIFGHPIGVCDWCGVNGLKLYEYRGKDICYSCLEELSDYDNVQWKRDQLEETRNLIKKANKNYNT